jgi:hypothetical protein
MASALNKSCIPPQRELFAAEVFSADSVSANPISTNPAVPSDA